MDSHTNSKIDSATLCKELIRAESEEDVISILKDYDLWQNDESWKPLGGSKNNYSTANNQSSTAIGALTELLINSCDANLTRKCLEKGIDPKDKQKAPKSVQEAVEKFYNIKRSGLAELTLQRKKELAENTCGIVVTGTKSHPSYAVYDCGQGQKPDDFEETFLSIGSDNKIGIFFVQGKFNQGSHGILVHCGEHAFKLIVSKSWEDEDQSNGEWGFTLLRRRRAVKDEKISSVQYLVVNGRIPRFCADELMVIPEGKNPYSRGLKSGSFIKLYTFKMEQKTSASLDFSYNLDSYLPAPALPIGIFETRDYKHHGADYSTFTGLQARLSELESSNKIEPQFPISGIINISYGKLKYKVWALSETPANNKKRAVRTHYSPKHGIILSVNGQKHASQDRRFYKRKDVGLDGLQDDLICILDCTDLTNDKLEDVFKTNREKMNEEPEKEILTALTEILNRNPILRELKNKRREEMSKKATSNNKIMENLFKNILKKHPAFNDFLNTDGNLQRPYAPKRLKEEPTTFEGEYYPTYFKLEKEYPENKPRETGREKFFDVRFKTDACDNYLTRDNYQGNFSLTLEGQNHQHSIHFDKGTCTVKIHLDKHIEAENLLEFKYELTNTDGGHDPFSGNFFVKVIERKKDTRAPDKTTTKSPDDNGKDLAGMSIRPPIPIKEADWGKHKMNEKSALIAVHNDGDKYDFFYNEDNRSLQTEIKTSKIPADILKNQFSIGLQMLALGYIANNKNEKETDNITTTIAKFTEGAAAAIIPVINGLSDIGKHIDKDEEIGGDEEFEIE